jgi:hypothetical protein
VRLKTEPRLTESLTVLYLRMLEQVLEMTFFSRQACLISKKPKHRETVFLIYYDTCCASSSLEGFFIMKIVRNTLFCVLTNEINCHSVRHTSVTQQIEQDRVSKMIQFNRKRGGITGAV